MSSPIDGETALVLIVDDEEPIAALMAIVVQERGYRTQIASNGRQALELARTVWPALVITDLMMPEFDGAALIAALRVETATNNRAYLPIILMTVAGTAHARRTGADAVLGKPFHLNALEQMIARFLVGPSAGGRQKDGRGPPLG